MAATHSSGERRARETWRRESLGGGGDGSHGRQRRQWWPPGFDLVLIPVVRVESHQ
ncbi:hypothetical protein HanIR_Chr12g0605381 [Helianthus annuus]|nr:hypothetical protein HanIR_Chr12g0605381 [Helianthus annuus]